MKQIDISVIIPIYNVSSYLEECLDSVLGQTYAPMEILLIDDGSVDGSEQICDRYAETDARIRVVHQNNRGVSTARNIGLSMAKGNYISFVDADDVISPFFYESLASVEADVVQCGFTSKRELLSQRRQTNFQYTKGQLFCEKLQLDSTGAYIGLWNKLWKRSCFDGLSFPNGRIHEDEFISWRALYHASRIAYTGNPLYFYRRRLHSITHSAFSERNLDLLDALRERRQYYELFGESHLSHLTNATFCYVLRGLMPEIRVLQPDRILEYRQELRNTYREVMSASDIGVFKKISLTLKMIYPELHQYIKEHFNGGNQRNHAYL